MVTSSGDRPKAETYPGNNGVGTVVAAITTANVTATMTEAGRKPFSRVTRCSLGGIRF